MKCFRHINIAIVLGFTQAAGGPAAAQKAAPPSTEEIAPAKALTAIVTQLPQIGATTREDLERTFSFCHTQRAHLAGLRQKFPGLEAQVQEAEEEWEATYGQGEAGVTERLKDLLGTEWPPMQAALTEKLNAKAVAVTHGLTQVLAEQFLAKVRERAKGMLDSPQREMLPACDPRFVKEPDQEWRRGYTRQWSSQGNPRAHGVELMLRVPLSWKEMEVDEPKGTAAWQCDGGHGPEAILVTVHKFPAPLTEEKKTEAFTEQFARKLSFGSDGRMLGFFPIRLGDLPAAAFVYVQSVERPAGTVEIEMAAFYVINQDALITVAFTSTAPGDHAVRSTRLAHLGPLMKLIFGSMKLKEQE